MAPVSDDTDNGASPESDSVSIEDPAAPMPIVGIGASAGGIDALHRFFEAMPSDSGMAFVVVLHLSAAFESNLASILQQSTDMTVETVEEGMEMASNHVYVIPPGQRLAIQDGTLRLTETTRPHDSSSVDRFFRSLASDQGENAVGIVLSGSGSDGTLGLRAIKEAGGVAMVQAPEDAEYDAMPESVLSTGLVDLSLPAAELAETLVAYRDRAGVIQLPKSEEALADEERSTLTQIFSELHRTTGLDFSNYKRSTVLRRLERRLQLRGKETLEAYLGLLQNEEDESRALQKDLLISVTSFFRDAEAFEALEQSVLPNLFADKGPTDQVRVWVPGCATGEEAYSIAMLLIEHAETVGTSASDFQVFGTDVDTEALAAARKGLYPKAIEADVSAGRLDRFFQLDGDLYQINPGLRDRVLFAEHNLLADPPFSNLDLVSCRNVLIYLNRRLQKHAYRLIHYGLREQGYLFLGRSEALGQANRLFSTLDGAHNILQARTHPKETRGHTPISSFLQRNRAPTTPPRDGQSASLKGRRRPSDLFSLPAAQPSKEDPAVAPETSAEGLHYQAMMEEVASVLVTDDREIVHLSGAADRYLRFEEGAPTSDLLSCVPDALRPELRGALYQAFDNGETAHRTGIQLPLEGEPRRLSFSVRPIEDDGSRYVHVRFEDLAGEETGSPSDADAVGTREAQLRQELDRTREQLQTTTEEYEAATEELETANEELLSMNEELQSKNEELETSKEELQSVNEELKATNQELKTKVEELRQSKGALENLMNATEIATLFLDRNLNIQRFTPAATALFELRDADVGRSLDNLTRRFAEKSLVDEARRVLREGVTLEREVHRGSDEWYLAKLRPYRTVDDETTGVVLTFVDITKRRLLERQLVNNTEKVRRQIGQDLHDILSSDLAALAMKIDNYRTRLEKKEGVDARPLADLAESAREAAEQSRTLSHALVPVTLQEENLAATLENLCREQGELADLELAYEGDRDEQLPRDKETAMHLYRIAHEAVINARRHAKARQVRIRLGRTDGCLEMVVRDDGIGMPDALDEAEGLGLRTMRYRANLIGASLSFGTGDDHGAVVRCELPLAKARE